MKKLLIFMLVLCLASVSQAALVGLKIGGSSQYVATAGETVTIDVVADAKSFGVELMTVEGNAAVATAVVDMDGAAGSTPSLGAGMLLINAGYLDNYDGVLFDYFSEYSTAGVAAGVVLASFEYTLDTLWDGTPYWVSPLVTGTSYEYASGSFDTAALSYASLDVGGTPTSIGITGVRIVPEPMTIALLGLGSLFLLKRRK